MNLLDNSNNYLNNNFNVKVFEYMNEFVVCDLQVIAPSVKSSCPVAYSRGAVHFRRSERRRDLVDLTKQFQDISVYAQSQEISFNCKIMPIMHLHIAL
jgi:hypothetical protein